MGRKVETIKHIPGKLLIQRVTLDGQDLIEHEVLHARARRDADRKAQPKTRLLGHARAGDCVGPGSVTADTLEDTTTGERTKIT